MTRTSNPNWSNRILRRSDCLCLLAVLVALFTPAFSWSQADRGTITGTISDPSGAVVAGVRVTATNPATGITVTSSSNNEGIYNLLNLPVATYSLRYSRSGFKILDRNGVSIQVQQRAQIDVKLEVGSEDQTVTVTAAPALQTQTELGTNLTSQVITDLPLTANGGRDLTAFAFRLHRR